ncbi:MAG: nicotinate phosphoribosyltransferase [Acidobacteria bacterium]|nr:nicotinate phosphoribosyltransferase [Acidobacteriota bacterium]
MYGLQTDLYQLTMAAGYFQAGKTHEIATFELFVRRFPTNRNYLIAAGLQQVVDYLLNLRFTREEADYLRGLPQFRNAPPEFFAALEQFRFSGDLFAVPEGTPVFPGEPFLTVRAPIIEAQIPETFLLATVGFQSMIATKAARIVDAAKGRAVVEFGTRRAHSAHAGMIAGRAAYIGGCIGTSNTETGFRFGIPVFGTAAHSWVQSFGTEREAFEQLQQLMGNATVYLIDTYDTLRGAATAASLGQPVWGVRLDSGNLRELAPAVRAILDGAGLRDAKIMATGDLNEYKILELIAADAPIDSFGVGTELATSADAPSLGAVYKLVEMQSNGTRRFTAKYSPEKHTLPGAKQIFRYADRDVVGCQSECMPSPHGAGEPQALLRPVILKGELVAPPPTVHQAREHRERSLAPFPSLVRTLFTREDAWPVERSEKLETLAAQVRQSAAVERKQ